MISSFFSSRLPSSLRILGLLLLCFMASSCSTWFSDNYQKPQVELTHVELVYARLLEQEFLLEFRIDNPNSQSLPIRGINYHLNLNNVPLGNGQSNQWLTVPGNSSERMQLRIHTNLWRQVKSLLDWLKNPEQSIHYSLQGELKTGLMFNKKVPFRRQGEFTPLEYLHTDP